MLSWYSIKSWYKLSILAGLSLFFSFFFMITYLVHERRKKHQQNPHQTVNTVRVILKRTQSSQIWDLFYSWFLNSNVWNSSLSTSFSLYVSWETLSPQREIVTSKCKSDHLWFSPVFSMRLGEGTCKVNWTPEVRGTSRLTWDICDFRKRAVAWRTLWHVTDLRNRASLLILISLWHHG